ncbi:MAG TPA: cofactor-independent phosphoglycerate mutase, partial [Acidobacteriota bacterium]|nr:cofactor-independent phosphoglycerate mutase [Acidobacteriota bacterium]
MTRLVSRTSVSNSRPKSKCLFVIQDGLGDRPIAALGNRTPLEAAHTPNMDRLIRRGVA